MGEIDKGIPQVGMRFRNADEAWVFWVAYGGRVGFDVRKRNKHVSKMDGQVTSCTFVCSNEGIRKKGITMDHEPKRVRAETRTNCKARMTISLDRVQRNYEVTDIVLEHNHCLQLPQTCHLMASQRKISELQAFEIEAAEDSGIMPQAAHEFACRQVGGPLNLGYTCRDQKNYLRTKRQRELAYGQAGSMLKYFHNKMIENPSFQYALQLDCEEDIANIFWADAKMLLDYAHFGDVVTFDTTFGTNKEYRPFGVFLGPNQFRETTIFGAALLFDETFESFKVAPSKKKGAKQKKNDGGQPQVRVEKDDGGQRQVRVEKDDGDKRANVELEESNTVVSYTQLLMTPLGGVYDENLF